MLRLKDGLSFYVFLEFVFLSCMQYLSSYMWHQMIWNHLQLEQQIQEIEQFYSSNCKNKLIDVKNNSVRIKDKGRHATRSQNQQDGKAASERMDDLVNQFDTILNQVFCSRLSCLIISVNLFKKL